MEAATAATTSDPDRNPHFRRRWLEAPCPLPSYAPQATRHDWPNGGGRALLELWRRMRSLGRGGGLCRHLADVAAELGQEASHAGA